MAVDYKDKSENIFYAMVKVEIDSINKNIEKISSKIEEKECELFFKSFSCLTKSINALSKVFCNSFVLIND